MTNEQRNGQPMQELVPNVLNGSILKDISNIGIFQHTKLIELDYNKKTLPQEFLIDHEVQRAIINPQSTNQIVQSLEFDKVAFNPVLISAPYKVSNQLLHDSSADIEQIIKEQGARALAFTLEQEMLSTGLAQGDGFHFQAIAKAPNVQVKSVKFTGVTDENGNDLGVLDEEDVVLAAREITKGFIAGKPSAIVFSNGVQNVMKPNGTTTFEYDTTNCYTNGKTTYFADLADNNAGSKTVGIVFMPEAYGFAISPTNIVKIDSDTENAMEGTTTFIISAFADAKVINPKAVKVLGYDYVTPVTSPAEPTA